MTGTHEGMVALVTGAAGGIEQVFSPPGVTPDIAPGSEDCRHVRHHGGKGRREKPGQNDRGA